MKPVLQQKSSTARSVFGAIVVRPLSTAEVRVASRFIFVRRGALVGSGGR